LQIVKTPDIINARSTVRPEPKNASKTDKNSSGDEIANVNFSYDHIVQYFKIYSVVEYSTRRRPWRREWVWSRVISAEVPQGETFGKHWIFMYARSRAQHGHGLLPVQHSRGRATMAD